jgi:Tol biopolymer transport system component
MAGQAASPPPTPVFLATLSVRDSKVDIGKPINISNNAGYDNRPSFTPDSAAVLFTSVRGGASRSGRSEGTTSAVTVPTGDQSVTNTPEAEYSPTVTPDGRHI